MDSSWLIGAGAIVGLGFYLNSISDSKSTADIGISAVTTELADSDKPSFSSLDRTNPEYFSASEDWVKTFNTSCGWSDEEQYCPEAIVEAANCPTECTRPYYQTSMDLRNSQGWSEWSSPEANDCGKVKFACHTGKIGNPKGSCPPIRARARLVGGPIHNNNFIFEVEWQIYSRLTFPSLDELAECGGPFWGWQGGSWSGNTWAATIDEVLLNGNSSLSIVKNSADNSVIYTNLSTSGTRGNRAIGGAYNICGVGEIQETATYQKYITALDFSDPAVINEFYVGAYDLEVQINIGREQNNLWHNLDPVIDGAGEWAEGTILDTTSCEFNKTINMTINNFVFIGPSTEENCCNPILLEDRYEDTERPDFPHDKFYYDKIEAATGGGYKLNNINAWAAAPSERKCGTAHPLILCNSDTQSNNAETFFPRNGFMMW